MEQNQPDGSGQGRSRRGHFHRNRRGPDRRNQGRQEPRQSSSADTPAPPRAEHVDVEQIMRDIRARIAHRHGIDLSPAQITELAARRLEAILDPRNVNPTLLEQLRQAAGTRPIKEPAITPAAPPYTFEDTTLYESHRGLLRGIRKLLNPILKLFFNPNPIAHALNTQARLNAEAAEREQERDRQQAEWNALLFELLRRTVTESAKLSLEVQALALRVESLSARVDFADRRVRQLEAPSLPRQSHRPAPHDTATTPPVPTPTMGTASSESPAPTAATDGQGADGQRRRRRRRRGRRGNGPFTEGGQGQTEAAGDATTDDFDTTGDGDEGDADGMDVTTPTDSTTATPEDRASANTASTEARAASGEANAASGEQGAASADAPSTIESTAPSTTPARTSVESSSVNTSPVPAAAAAASGETGVTATPAAGSPTTDHAASPAPDDTASSDASS